jgi:hypothetical protein
MENLPKDLVMTIALEILSLPDIVSMTLTSKRMRDIICDNEIFWMNKVKKDYPGIFNNLIKKEIKNFSWKSLYERISNVRKENAKFGLLYKESVLLMMRFNNWDNPSGMKFNDMQGWKLYRDKNIENIFYLSPASYFTLFGPKPKEGENHPLNLIKIEFLPKPIITKIPWNQNLLGEDIHYRRSDGKVFWYDSLYEYKFEFDGSYYRFNTYFLIY